METARAGKAYVPSGERFNSATAVKPWRQWKGSVMIDFSDPLQFGHGGEAVETSAAVTPAEPSSTLQFGHGGEAVETQDAARVGFPGDAASIRPRR